MLSWRVFLVILLFVRNFAAGSLVSQFAKAIKDSNLDQINELAASDPSLLTTFNTEVWHEVLFSSGLSLYDGEESDFDLQSPVPHFQSLDHLCLFMTRKMNDPNEIVRGTTPLCMSIICGSSSVALELLRRPDVSINQKDARGRTPFMYAVVFKSMPLIRIMLDRGVDVDETDYRGYTALHYACRLNPSHLRNRIIELILTADAAVLTHPPYKLLKSNQGMDKIIARRVATVKRELNMQRAYMLVVAMIIFACSYTDCKSLFI